MRSQLISQELEGEKIDFVKYDIDPRQFIKNALSPAEVKTVYVLDESKHTALAIVADKELSIAIGKMGQNVKLANRLCDWNIDVKTEEQYLQDSRNLELKRAADSLFVEQPEESEEEGGDSVMLEDILGLKAAQVEILAAAGISLVEDFLEKDVSQLAALSGIDPVELASIRATIEENIEIVQEEEEPVTEAEEYTCPDCGSAVTPDMKKCPSCGVELSFEYDDQEE